MNSFVEHAVLDAPSHTAFDKAALLRGIDALSPQFKAAARQTERDGQVPDSHMQALRDIGYFDIVKPREFGGYQEHFDVLVEANLQLARSCASTAWVAGLLSAHQWLAASFPVQAQRDVWGDNPDALLCGSYAPAAKAGVDDGGYRLSGTWSFSSGCENADWALCAAMIPALSGDGLEPAFLLVPAADYTILETWDVVGLGGTGSKTLELKEVFVPGHRVLTFAQSTSGNTPGAGHYADDLAFRVPMLTVIPSCLASVAVGAAAGALDDYLEATGARVTRGAVAGAHQKMAEFPTIQLRVADAAASTDAAQEILLRDLRRVTDKTLAGDAVTVEDRILSRRGQSFAVSLALRAAEALNASTGGLGLNLSNPVQRAWRDVNAVSRHISMNWDAVGTMYGQMALGLTPRGQY